jgi:hypothetical protein
MSAFRDLTGLKFGRLTALSGYRVNGKFRYECKCDCGNSVVLDAGVLTRSYGNTTSCGCYSSEVHADVARRLHTTHGKTAGGKQSKAYKSWAAMKKRCYNEKDKSFHHYGGRGIFVCERWHIFENFLSDMGEPDAGLSIERVDNNGPYSPDNCRWATQREQTQNTRRTRYVCFKGVTKPISVWCSELGLKYESVRRQLVDYGWPVERAFGISMEAA